jgi:hypothetical protein
MESAMSVEPPREKRILRLWRGTVLVISRALNGIGAAVYFGQWGFGVGLLLGLLAGGIMYLALDDPGMAWAGGPLWGVGLGTAAGAVAGLILGALFPQAADRIASHPLIRPPREMPLVRKPDQAEQPPVSLPLPAETSAQKAPAPSRGDAASPVARNTGNPPPSA